VEILKIITSFMDIFHIHFQEYRNFNELTSVRVCACVLGPREGEGKGAQQQERLGDRDSDR